MSYHPIMGITIFFLFVILAFFLGKKTYKESEKETKNKVFKLKIKKKIKSEAISPDASWLD